jgi:hypothetical protein
MGCPYHTNGNDSRSAALLTIWRYKPHCFPLQMFRGTGRQIKSLLFGQPPNASLVLAELGNKSHFPTSSLKDKSAFRGTAHISDYRASLRCHLLSEPSGEPA